MGINLKAPLFASVCGALLLVATPSISAVLSGAADLREEGASTSSLVQQVSHGAPAGKRCVKWTRRWNTRHGVGHRRCVQWR
jgi:hypothetical protein